MAKKQHKINTETDKACVPYYLCYWASLPQWRRRTENIW